MQGREGAERETPMSPESLRCSPGPIKDPRQWHPHPRLTPKVLFAPLPEIHEPSPHEESGPGVT